MMNFENTVTDELPVRIAAALLARYGEISTGEIRAIPTVETDEQAMEIARQLAQLFELEVSQIRSAQNTWVDLLRVRADVEPDF
jgi:hypothetical protein